MAWILFYQYVPRSASGESFSFPVSLVRSRRGASPTASERLIYFARNVVKALRELLVSMPLSDLTTISSKAPAGESWAQSIAFDSRLIGVCLFSAYYLASAELMPHLTYGTGTKPLLITAFCLGVVGVGIMNGARRVVPRVLDRLMRKWRNLALLDQVAAELATLQLPKRFDSPYR